MKTWYSFITGVLTLLQAGIFPLRRFLTNCIFDPASKHVRVAKFGGTTMAGQLQRGVLLPKATLHVGAGGA